MCMVWVYLMNSTKWKPIYNDKEQIGLSQRWRYRLEFQEESFTLVVAALMYMFLKTYWTVHLKSVHFLIWKLYLDKTDFFFKSQQNPHQDCLCADGLKYGIPTPTHCFVLVLLIPS